MLRTRVIPLLLLRNESLVKTVRFDRFTYIGDPCNTIRIFNELEVDELLFVDITATIENRKPNFKLLQGMASECFMPLGYGGGIEKFEYAEKIFEIGFEKIVINSHNFIREKLLADLANHFGSQAIIASIDVRRNFWQKYEVCGRSGTYNSRKDPVEWARYLESLGAGEILLTSINREGTWKGFDLELVEKVASAVSIPVVAQGGCGSLDDIYRVVNSAGASAVAIGSMVVFQKKDMGVLINFPSRDQLEQLFPDEVS